MISLCKPFKPILVNELLLVLDEAIDGVVEKVVKCYADNETVADRVKYALKSKITELDLEDMKGELCLHGSYGEFFEFEVLPKGRYELVVKIFNPCCFFALVKTGFSGSLKPYVYDVNFIKLVFEKERVLERRFHFFKRKRYKHLEPVIPGKCLRKQRKEVQFHD